MTVFWRVLQIGYDQFAKLTKLCLGRKTETQKLRRQRLDLRCGYGAALLIDPEHGNGRAQLQPLDQTINVANTEALGSLPFIAANFQQLIASEILSISRTR